MRNLIALIITALIAAVAAPALAAPITYYVYDATWEDGGTLTGQFTYDLDTNTFSDISLVTTTGTAYPGSTYVTVNPATGASSEVLVVVTASGNAAGRPIMALGFPTPLSNAGGTVGLSTASGEGTCSATCTSFASGPRQLLAGATVSDEPPPPIPTLAEWAMILMSLALAASALVAIRHRSAEIQA